MQKMFFAIFLLLSISVIFVCERELERATADDDGDDSADCLQPISTADRISTLGPRCKKRIFPILITQLVRLSDDGNFKTAAAGN